MYNLEVREIEFDDYEKAGKNKNYPESGFYLRTVKPPTPPKKKLEM